LDVDTMVPMRWPCGPLAVERETRRPGSSARDVDVLRRWCEPAALDVLAGSPVDALVVPWAEGTAADDEQPPALAGLVAAARSRGLSVVGWVSEPADLKRAAGAARAAGLAAVATESTAPLEGESVLRFRKRDVAGLTTASLGPAGFLGDAEAVWPGMRPQKREADVDAVSGATARPWLDSNAWYVRLARGLASPRVVWLAFEPADEGPAPTADAYLQALADTEAGGARWLVSLDRSLRAGLAEGRAPERGTWERIGRGLDFFRRHSAWRGYRPVGQIGVVSDFSGANEFLSHELLNLLSRRSALFRAIRSDATASLDLDGLDAVLYVDEGAPAKEIASVLDAFVERGGTLIAPPGWKTSGVPDASVDNPRFQVFRLGQGRVAVARAAVDDPDRLAEDAELLVSHRHDRVRVYNLGVSQHHYSTSADGRSGVLHVLAYPTPYPRQAVTAWFREPWASARDWRIEAKDASPLAGKAAGGGVEFHVPAVPAYCALEVSS
jgi:hypothetical protein